MEITDVRIKPISDSSERLKAVCTITFDDVFVVRDIKIVDGVNGMFVAMPSRKVSVSCPSCGHKNAIRARYCNECGTRLPSQEASSQDDDGRSKMHRDIAHPITSEFRSMIQSTVIERFENADGEFDQEESTPRGRQQANDSRQAADQTSEQDEYSSIIAELKGGKSRSSSQSDSGSRSRGGRKPRDGRGRSEKGGSRRDRQDQGNRDSQEAEEVVSSENRNEKSESRSDGRRKRRGRGRGRGRDEDNDRPTREETRNDDAVEVEAVEEVVEAPVVEEPVREESDDLPFGAMIDEVPDEIVEPRNKKSDAKSGKKAKKPRSSKAPKAKAKEEEKVTEDKVILEEEIAAADEPENANEDSSPFGLGLL